MNTKTWFYSVAFFLLVCVSISATGADNATTPVVIPNSDLLRSESPWEVSVQPTYGSDAEQNPQVFGVNVTARQTFTILPIDVRYRANARNTFVLRVPYLRKQEELGVANETVQMTDSGLGDIVVGLEHSFRPARMSGWEGQLGFTVKVPTGKNVYDNLSENELPMGVGHYETGVSLAYRRLSDPVVVNAGLNIGYIWPHRRNGETVRPGVGFTLKTGIGYALSDRWIATEELEFVRQPNVFLQSAFTAITETVNQAYITHGFLYNRSRDSASYSLLFSIGLNNQSTDFMITLGACY